VLIPELRPAGIQLVGETIGDVGRQDVVRQIATAVVDNRLFSDQVKMITGHVLQTQCLASCSRRWPIAMTILGIVVDVIERMNIMVWPD
jgi:hypothetical protein